MGRLTTIFFCIVFFLPVAKASGDTTLILLPQKVIAGTYSNFYTDNLGNIFLLSKNNQVKKLNQNFDSVAVFNDVRRYGDIYLLDVNNPLKIAVYYKDFTTILVLDRFLNMRNAIDLRTAGILQAKAVTQSYDNNYWVFDELDNAIKKIDDNGNVLLQSADFRILFSEPYNPSRLIDADGLLYVYDEKKGWLVFDYYGTYKQHIDMPGWKDVRVENGNLSGHDSVYFYATNRKTFSDIKAVANIDLTNVFKIERRLNMVFALTATGLEVYQIKQ